MASSSFFEIVRAKKKTLAESNVDVALVWARVLEPCLRDRNWDELHANELRQHYTLCMSKDAKERRTWRAEASLASSNVHMVHFLLATFIQLLRDAIASECSLKALLKQATVQTLLTVLHMAFEGNEAHEQNRFDVRVVGEVLCEVQALTIEEALRVEERKRQLLERQVRSAQEGNETLWYRLRNCARHLRPLRFVFELRLFHNRNAIDKWQWRKC